MEYRRDLSVAIVLAAILFAGHASAAPVYVALGASDALGVGASDYNASDPTQPNNGYVYRIHDWLRARYAPWVLLNLGVSGATAEGIRDAEVGPAIAARPSIATVWAGGNDVKNSAPFLEPTATLAARFEPAYTEIIRRLSTETGAFIVTANLPDMSRIPVAAYFDATRRQRAYDDTLALNEIIARVAASYGVPVVDLFSDPESYNPASYSSDGFHPNDSGYARMATAYEDVLRARAWRVVSGLGDVDGDGAVTATDAALTLRAAGGISALGERPQVAADTWPAGGDGVIGILDAITTLRRANSLVPDAGWR